MITIYDNMVALKVTILIKKLKCIKIDYTVFKLSIKL